MKNKIEKIVNDLDEIIGFSLEIYGKQKPLLTNVSYPGHKTKTNLNQTEILYSNITSDYWGSWSIQNKQSEKFNILPYISSSQIEQFKLANQTHREYWLNHFRRVILSEDEKLLSNGNWRMVYSTSPKQDWSYPSNKFRQTNLKGHIYLNKVFETENPRYSDFEMANIPIATKQNPFTDSGRVKFWRKKIKEGALPPIVMVHLSQLSNSVIVDGHSRLMASILESTCPSIITFYPVAEQHIKPNLELADKRATALINQFNTNPKLKLNQLNRLLISFYDDRPWLVRRTKAKFINNEEQWNNEVKELINRLNLKHEITRIEKETEVETGYNTL